MNELIFQRLSNGDKGQFILFPYLGGHSNVYQDLVKRMPSDIEIWSANPPGHGGSGMNLINDIQILIDLYFQEMVSIMKPGCILFGHSMGGIVAFSLLQKLFNETNSVKPAALILSACNEPRHFKKKHFEAIPDSALLDYLKQYNVISQEFLAEETLLAHFVPIFRSDFMILESASIYEYQRLSIPVYFLWGESDAIVPMCAAIQWKKYFTTPIRLIPINRGSHMFIHEKMELVIEKLVGIMSQILT
jgi:external thioesterase TEII